MAGGGVVVADGYYAKRHVLVDAADVLGWPLLWDACYRTDAPGHLTPECKSDRARYGIPEKRKAGRR